MRLSFITDEVTQDLSRAIEIAKANDIEGLELRSIEDHQIDVIPYETLQHMSCMISKESLVVSDIASNFFKCEYTEENVDAELEKLERLCIAAEVLSCDTIRGFTFFRKPKQLSTEEIAEQLFRAKPILERYGKRLLLEADPSVNTTNHMALAHLLDLVDCNIFMAIYDPGNDMFDPYGEKPFPDGYHAIKKHIAHIHVKDAIVKRGETVCVAPGHGEVGFRELIVTLKSDGYDGWLSLEPHYRKDLLLSEAQMKLPGGRLFSLGGEASMQECIDAIKELLQ